MSIQLMLANEQGVPVFSEDGLPDEIAEWTIEPTDEEWGLRYDYSAKDPNDLSLQRWAIVVPEGPEGQRLAEIVAPLRAARKAQQGGKEPLVFKVPMGLTGEQAGDWWSTVYKSEDIKRVDRPRYLLLLGDSNMISWEAQQRFASGAFVGRLAFPNDAGYEAYIHKLLAYERAERSAIKKVQALFHTVRDGTAATATGHRGLMAPTIDAARDGLDKKEFTAAQITDLGENGPISPEDFLRLTATRDPAVLFSISHGIGASPETSDEERRRIQGAMSFGSSKRITAEDVANRPFLPGGAWFFFACFSAGTPKDTAYRHWLQNMKDAGMNVRQSDIDSVLAALPKDASFVAALPQAALANPDGPLAVMGHVDLAWTFSFQDGSKKFRPSRFHNVFRGIVEHSRIGCSFNDLQLIFNDVNADLAEMVETEERYRRRNEALPDAKTRPIKKVGLWMLRQDLAAYVLLGDPAARVTATASAEEVRKPVPSIVATNSGDTKTINAAAGDEPDVLGDAPAATNPLLKLDPAQVEAVIFASLGAETLNAIAQQLGATREDLDAWLNVYQAGGRSAVQSKTSV